MVSSDSEPEFLEADTVQEADSDEKVTKSDLSQDLKEWATKHGTTRECVNDLLGMLRSRGHTLPKDCRTLQVYQNSEWYPEIHFKKRNIS